jgi:nitrate reductase delta subunit
VTTSASSDLLRSLAVVSEDVSPDHHRVAASLGITPDTAAHTDLFCLQLPPFAAVYLGPEGMLGGDAAERAAGFWRALGLVPPAEPDHLAALLGLYSAIVGAEADEADFARRVLWGEARRGLLWEHLLPWMPVYARAAARSATAAYRPWAEALASTLLAEAAAHPAGDDFLPLHFREAPPAATPEAGDLEGYLRHLLTPVRSGIVITRRDLARAARRLGLGLRMGERAFVLSALVRQDPPAVIGWLRDQAEEWAGDHERLATALGPVARFWRTRAEASAHHLAEVQQDLQRLSAAG